MRFSFFVRRSVALCVLTTTAIAGTVAAAASARQIIIEETTRPSRTGRQKKTPPAPAASPTPAPSATPRPRPRPRPAPTATLEWKTLVRGGGEETTPFVTGRTAFVTAGGQVQQVDSGGRTQWASEIGATDAGPLTDDNRVYVGTTRGTVYALNRRTGGQLWKWTGAQNPIRTCAAVGGGRLYIESSDNNIYGLAASTGGRIWTFTRPDGSLGYGDPVYVAPDATANLLEKASSAALFAVGDTTVYRLDPTNGKETWHTLVNGKALATPGLGGGKVFVGNDGGGLIALSALDGKTAWIFKGKSADGGEWFRAPQFGDGVVYAPTVDRVVYAVDAGTGKPRWTYQAPGGGTLSGSVLDTKNHALYVTVAGIADESPSVFALDTRTGKKLWDYRAGSVGSAPALSEDRERLYVTSANGYLYCLGVR